MAVEALVSSIVKKLLNSGADAIGAQLRIAWGLEGGLLKLDRFLKSIQSILADAEEKQTVDDDVRTWLDALKKVAYEAEDVLDELNYETLRHKAAEVAGDKTPCSGKVCDFFSSHNPLLMRLKMGRKLNNLLEEIDEIAAGSTKFNFSKVNQTADPENAQPQTAPPANRETISLVKESDVVGRHGDKDQIVNTLIKSHSNAENVKVLPIVGMGGVGKTTLAQLIYNDTPVVEYFQLRVWVCISDHWDIKEIIKNILQSATRKPCGWTRLEDLQLDLRNALDHNRFLIVLDDVWEEDPIKWKTLKDILDYGGRGSAVIVTTRSDRVSEITGTLKSCGLAYLSDDEAWDLFSRRAFAPGDEKPEELVEVGKAIANKCGGLPLALVMLGNLLYMKRDRSQWLDIKDSNIWDTKTGIIPALRLSYKHLPLHSKRCFAFCAIFPKDHEMDKEELINMWMAHDFIPSTGGRLEVRGNEIFNQLVQRSFFQDVKEKKGGFYYLDYARQTKCRMHDLVHDLAQSIVKNECVALLPEGAPKVTQLLKDVYHLSVPRGILDIKNTLKASPNLHTILSTGNDKYDGNIPGSTSLRVLKFPNGRLPTSMKYVRHLRYLQLHISLKELPESICTLLHLQTLDLSGCGKLLRLPKRMACMISLRHLYLDGCGELKTMAPGMGRMTNLQTLTHYAVSEETGAGIGELKELRLSSRLVVRNLELVKDAKEAREILQSKEELTSLLLDWTIPGRRINNEEQVLEELKPPRLLKFLTIWHYDGSKFPSWMTDLHHLVKLHLVICTGSHRLPPLWQLNSLEDLYLNYMNNLEYIISDNTTMQAFRSLRELNLENMGNLKGWWENENNQQQEGMAGCFPALVDLTIKNCPELVGSIPMAPCLKSLRSTRSKKIRLGSISGLNSLVELHLENCTELHRLPPLWQLNSLEELHLAYMDNLEYIVSENTSDDTTVQAFRSLKKLELYNLKSLKDWWENKNVPQLEGMANCFPALVNLRIWECPELAGSIPMAPCLKRLDLFHSGKIPLGSISSLTSLVSLRIENPREEEDEHDRTFLPHDIVTLRHLQCLEDLTVEGSHKVALVWRHKDNEQEEEEEGSSHSSLKHLKLKNCSWIFLDKYDGFWTSMASLESLKIQECSALVAFPYKALQGLKSLQELSIWDCNNMTDESPATDSGSTFLPKLEMLYLARCSRLETLPSIWGPSLKRLEITGCKNLVSIKATEQEFGHLTSLESMTIWNCPRLKSLPIRFLSTLKEFDVMNCPELAEKCAIGGEYWNLVSHIKSR